MKITIIVNSWHYFDNPFKLQPLHELHYATMLENRFNDAEIELLDLRESRRSSKCDLDQYVDMIATESDLFIYWIMKVADYVECVNVMNKLRKMYPNSKHISGGTHINNSPQDGEKIFDAIIGGPGEGAMIDVVDNMMNNRSFDSRYKSSWGDHELSSYPIASRSYLPKRAIANKELFKKYGEVAGTSVMFSRGCDFKCTYCVYNFPDRAQYRTPKQIEDEIDYLKKSYGIGAVNLRDEICIPMRPDISTPFLEAIGNGNIMWRGQTRVGIKKQAIDLAAATGCKELSIGVESASEEVRKAIRKTATFENVKNFVDWSHDVDIKIKLCLILGLPGEPLDIRDKTIRFIEDVDPDFVAVSAFCPTPGSHIHSNQKYYGIRKIDDNYSKFAHLVYRFGDKEEHGLPFEYEDTEKWGKAMGRQDILDNIKFVQKYLRERNMSY